MGLHAGGQDAPEERLNPNPPGGIQHRLELRLEGEKMNRSLRFAAILALLAAVAVPVLAEADVFTLDKAHSLVGFRIRHFVSKVEGRFKDYDGTIWIDRANPAASKVDVTIKADSI